MPSITEQNLIEKGIVFDSTIDLYLRAIRSTWPDLIIDAPNLSREMKSSWTALVPLTTFKADGLPAVQLFMIGADEVEKHEYRHQPGAEKAINTIIYRNDGHKEDFIIHAPYGSIERWVTSQEPPLYADMTMVWLRPGKRNREVSGNIPVIGLSFPNHDFNNRAGILMIYKAFIITPSMDFNEKVISRGFTKGYLPVFVQAVESGFVDR